MPAAIPIAIAASSGIAALSQWGSNRAQSKAYDKQLQGERYSLDRQAQLEEQRMAEEKRRYDMESKAREPYERLRMAALQALTKSYGIDLPNLGALGGGPKPPRVSSARTLAELGQQQAAPQAGGGVGAPFRTGQAPTMGGQAQVSPVRTLADLAQLTQFLKPGAMTQG